MPRRRATTPADATIGGGCCGPVVAAPLGADQAVELARILKALAEPTRLRLLSLLASAPGEMCVCDLTVAFDRAESAISHHLKVLRQAGLVESRRCGTWIYYRPQPENLKRFSALLDNPGRAPGPA